MQQLSKHVEDLHCIVRAIELQQQELELIILRTPTGHVREQLTEANIYLMAAIQNLTEIS